MNTKPIFSRNPFFWLLMFFIPVIWSLEFMAPFIGLGPSFFILLVMMGVLSLMAFLSHRHVLEEEESIGIKKIVFTGWAKALLVVSVVIFIFPFLVLFSAAFWYQPMDGFSPYTQLKRDFAFVSETIFFCLYGGMVGFLYLFQKRIMLSRMFLKEE